MTYQAVPPVQLWVWSLDEAQGAEAVLSDDERARAARMVVQLHAARFIAARSGLRRILGHCLGRDPAALAFALGPYGKPHLQAAPDIAFNLSHSDHLAAVVVTSAMPVGVDIERIRPVSDGLAARFFAPAEAAALAGVPQAARLAAFHACWTRKEAYIKAIGTGLATRLDSFAVSLDPSAPARLLWVADDANAGQNWQMHSFVPANGFAGAIAAPAKGWQVVHRQPPWMHQAAARASR
jgi:4'-phosphopantetheinyl transferase